MKLASPIAALLLALCACAPASSLAQGSADQPSGYTLEVLRDAAPDPIAALSLAIPLPQRADTWNAEILKRLAPLMGIARDPLLYWSTAENVLTLGAFGMKEEVRRSSPEVRGVPLDTVCGQPRGTNHVTCSSVALGRMAAAIHALAAGDSAAAEQPSEGVLAADGMLKPWLARNCDANLPRWPGAVHHECVSLATTRAIYEGMSGRAQAMVETLLTANRMTRYPDEAGQVPAPRVVNDIATQLLLRGQLRHFGQLVDALRRTDPQFGYLRVAFPLLRAIDIQTWSRTGVANAVNLLALAAKPEFFRAVSPRARPLFQITLECRAAAIRAQSPVTRAEAASALARLLLQSEQLGEPAFESTYCLTRLAGAVGDEDAQRRVAALAQKEQQRLADEAEQDARDYMRERTERTEDWNRMFRESIQSQDDRARFPNAGEAYVSSRRKSAGPWTRLVLDDAAYREALVENLNFSKALPEGDRPELVFRRVWNMVVFNELYRLPAP